MHCDLHTQITKVEDQNASLKASLAKISSASNRVLMVDSSGDVGIFDIKTKVKHAVNMKNKHSRYCLAKNVGFAGASSIGFGAEDVDLFGNDILFGFSRDKISALSLTTNRCLEFTGNLAYREYGMAYGHTNGLLMVGGRSDCFVNDALQSVEFNNGRFSQKRIARLPHSVTNPATIVKDERLFVCGGLKHTRDGKQVSHDSVMFDVERREWLSLTNLNNVHQFAGICFWKERATIVVAGGSLFESDPERAEEFDAHKNQWTDLPTLQRHYKARPALLTSNNILFCIGADRATVPINEGSIEMYDPRDKAKKWRFVNTLSGHFGSAVSANDSFEGFLAL